MLSSAFRKSLAPATRHAIRPHIHQSDLMLASRHMGFFSKFRESLKKEMAKEKSLQEDIKQLKEHETTQKMKEVSKAVGDSAVAAKQMVAEEVLKPGAEAAKKVIVDPLTNQVKAGAKVVAEKVSTTVEEVTSSEAFQKSTEAVRKTAKQIEQTRTVQAIAATVETTREALEKERRQQDGHVYFDEPPEELKKDMIPEDQLNTAELGIVVFDAPKSAWEKQLDKVAQHSSVQKVLNNPVVSGVTGAISGASRAVSMLSERMFPESEAGDVVRRIRQRDPKFNLFPFVNFLRDNVCEEVVKSFLKGDVDYLRRKCGDKAFAVLSASIKSREVVGVYPDTRILNITQVEYQSMMLSEEEVPTIIISFVCQQVNAGYNKAGKLVEGSEDDIRAVYYVWALQPDEKFADLRWRIAEMAIQGSLKLLS